MANDFPIWLYFPKILECDYQLIEGVAHLSSSLIIEPKRPLVTNLRKRVRMKKKLPTMIGFSTMLTGERLPTHRITANLIIYVECDYVFFPNMTRRIVWLPGTIMDGRSQLLGWEKTPFAQGGDEGGLIARGCWSRYRRRIVSQCISSSEQTNDSPAATTIPPSYLLPGSAPGPAPSLVISI